MWKRERVREKRIKKAKTRKPEWHQPHVYKTHLGIFIMQKVETKVARPVRVILNTTNTNRHQWAKIVEGRKVLHTGQPRYIKRVAKKKFNLDLLF